MGGMYNAIFGVNPFSRELLKILNLTPQDFGRFRDAHLVDGEIAVYTRLGGANASDYKHVYKKLEAHQRYARCVNDQFDDTYCTFFFSVNADERKRLHDMGCPDIRQWNPDEQWKRGLEAIKADPKEASRVVEAMNGNVTVLDGSGNKHSFKEFLESLAVNKKEPPG